MSTVQSRRELRELPVESIREDLSQPRQDFRESEDRELVASIREHDIKEPLGVYEKEGLYYLISGTRRFRAAVAAGLKSVPAFVYPNRMDESEIFLHQFLCNAHRLDLNPMETCVAYMGLMRHLDINATELAKVVSKSKTYVSNVLSLNSLDDDLKHMIRSGTLGLAKGALLARMSPEEQAEAKKSLQGGGLSRGELERKSSKKKSKGEAVRRVIFQMPSATLSLVGKSKMTVDEMISLFQSLIQEIRKARSQGFDVSTLSSMLRDRANLAANAEA